MLITRPDTSISYTISAELSIINLLLFHCSLIFYFKVIEYLKANVDL